MTKIENLLNELISKFSENPPEQPKQNVEKATQPVTKQPAPRKGAKPRNTGITTLGRIRYNQAMKKEARDNVDNPKYVQPDIRDWLRKNYPEGLIEKSKE